MNLSDFFSATGGKDIVYKGSGRPSTVLNPEEDFDLYMDIDSFTRWVCVDKTIDANVWVSENGDRIPTRFFGRLWNMTDDTYKRVGDRTAFTGLNLLEFDTWLSPLADRVNDDDVTTPSELTSYLDSSTFLPFAHMERKVVANDGIITAFDHATAPASNQQIMTSVPKFNYIQAHFTAEGKEYQLLAVSIDSFEIDLIIDLQFKYAGNIQVWNPTVGISSGTAISDTKLGSVVHPSFICNDGRVADETCIGSFHSVSGRSTFGSGIKGTASITRATARSQNSGFGADFHQHDFWNNSVVQLFAYIERGSNFLEQSNTKFDGYSWVSSASSYPYDNGLTLSLENKTGVVLDGSNRVIANSYRGIENYHSALWQWIDGINIDSGVAHLAKALATYVDDSDASPYFNSGKTVTTTASWQQINKWLAGTFMPDPVAGGSTTSRVSDQMYGNTGWRVLLFGGSLRNGGLSGLSCWSGYNDSSFAHWTIVSRSGFKNFF